MASNMSAVAAVARTRRVGGSLVVTIPKEAAEAGGIQDRDLVHIQVRKVRKDLFGSFPGIGHMEKGDRLDVRE